MSSRDVEDAASLATAYSPLSARDLIHLAIMRRVGSSQIVSADRAFEGVNGIERLDPLLVEEWAPRVTGG
jgi:predicted nucleic acid-binding protein